MIGDEITIFAKDISILFLDVVYTAVIYNQQIKDFRRAFKEQGISIHMQISGCVF